MYEQVEKRKKSKSCAVADSVAQKKSSVTQGFGFVDNRPEAVAQRKLREMVNNYSSQQQHPIQKKKHNMGVVQRILEINGKQYSSMGELARDKSDSYTKYSKCKDSKKANYLNDKNQVYRLTDQGNIKLTKKDAEVDPYAEKMKSNVRTPLATPPGPVAYPIGEALYAPIGHAIVVKGQGKYKYIGTDGLNGCVEVMMECKSRSGNVYLVAHVSSEINKDSEEIRSQLEVMRQAVNEYMEEEVTWSDFGFNEDQTGKMRLVRSSGGFGDQLLYQNMLRQLLDLGASLKEHVSNSLTMDISVPEARYLDNDLPKPKPKNVDQRDIKDYPFPE